MPILAQKYTAKLKSAFPYIGGLAIVLLSIANVYVAHRPPQQQNVLAAATADPIGQEIEFWQEVVRLHPTYRDGYIELAELYLEKDLQVAAKQAVDKALEIDPLSDRAKQLAEQINS
jgi:tetratricopeptide (TPR) repeat protein